MTAGLGPGLLLATVGAAVPRSLPRRASSAAGQHRAPPAVQAPEERPTPGDPWGLGSPTGVGRWGWGESGTGVGGDSDGVGVGVWHQGAVRAGAALGLRPGGGRVSRKAAQGTEGPTGPGGDAGRPPRKGPPPCVRHSPGGSVWGLMESGSGRWPAPAGERLQRTRGTRAGSRSQDGSRGGHR